MLEVYQCFYSVNCFLQWFISKLNRFVFIRVHSSDKSFTMNSYSATQDKYFSQDTVVSFQMRRISVEYLAAIAFTIKVKFHEHI